MISSMYCKFLEGIGPWLFLFFPLSFSLAPPYLPPLPLCFSLPIPTPPQ